MAVYPQWKQSHYSLNHQNKNMFQICLPKLSPEITTYYCIMYMCRLLPTRSRVIVNRTWEYQSASDNIYGTLYYCSFNIIRLVNWILVIHGNFKITIHRLPDRIDLKDAIHFEDWSMNTNLSEPTECVWGHSWLLSHKLIISSILW